MKIKTEGAQTNWNAVIGKCLAALVIENSELKDATVIKKADLLQRLGLSLKDSAAVLGTSEQSIHQQKYMNRKKRKRG